MSNIINLDDHRPLTLIDVATAKIVHDVEISAETRRLFFTFTRAFPPPDANAIHSLGWPE
jgi:hypothetical protein